MKKDEKLWNEFRGGCNAALSHIYYQNVQKLYRYGRKFTDNDELIKDTIQEVFFHLIETRPRLGRTDNISYYLYVCFRRKLALHIKANRQLKSIDSEKDMEQDIDFSFEHELVQEEGSSEKKQKLNKALAKLTLKQREILYYKYTCGFSYEQICELTSLKYDSARTQVSRALSALKRVLMGDGVSINFLTIFRFR